MSRTESIEASEAGFTDRVVVPSSQYYERLPNGCNGGCYQRGWIHYCCLVLISATLDLVSIFDNPVANPPRFTFIVVLRQCHHIAVVTQVEQA